MPKLEMGPDSREIDIMSLISDNKTEKKLKAGDRRKWLNGQIIKAQAGDNQAVEKLINEFRSYVYQMEKRYFIPGGDREDLFQEGMIGLYHAIKTYRSDSSLSFEDYASLSIRNSVIRAVRSATQKKQMVLTQAKSIFDSNIIDVSSIKFEPEEITIKTLTAENICSIINSKLSSKECEIIRMKLNGFNADEIADRFKTEKKVVDNALYRARQKIKKHLTTSSKTKKANPFIKTKILV